MSKEDRIFQLTLTYGTEAIFARRKKDKIKVYERMVEAIQKVCNE